MRIPLLQSISANANPDGSCILQLGPTVMGSSWTINSTSVQNNGATTPRVDIYRGVGVSPTAFIEGTKNGSANTSDTTFELRLGDMLTYHFTGCQPGSVCTVVVSGYTETGR